VAHRSVRDCWLWSNRLPCLAFGGSGDLGEWLAGSVDRELTDLLEPFLVLLFGGREIVPRLDFGDGAVCPCCDHVDVVCEEVDREGSDVHLVLGDVGAVDELLFDLAGEPLHVVSVSLDLLERADQLFFGAERGDEMEETPGLYFVGLKFLHSVSSEQIHGVGRDADYIADAIEERSGENRPDRPAARQEKHLESA